MAISGVIAEYLLKLFIFSCHVPGDIWRDGIPRNSARDANWLIFSGVNILLNFNLQWLYMWEAETGPANTIVQKVRNMHVTNNLNYAPIPSANATLKYALPSISTNIPFN